MSGQSNIPFMRWLQYRDFGRLWQVYGRSVLRYVTWRKLINAIRLEYAYRTRQTHFRANPYLVNFEPIYHCNLECPLCDRQMAPEKRSKENLRLPLEVVDKVLDEIGPDLFQVQIFGLGEPLLDWPRTKAIIERAHARRIFTLVSTNTTVLTDTMADEIVTCGLDYLVCAIDGISQESYSRYRVGGHVDVALKNLRTLVEARRKHHSSLVIEWQYLVHKHNQHEQEAARKIADELGVYLRFAPLRGMEFDPVLQREWLPDAPEPAPSRKAKNGKPNDAQNDDMFDRSRASAGDISSPLSCYFLWRSLIVTSRGSVTRCPIHHNSAHYGSLKTHSVKELYQSEATCRARSLFRPASKEAAPDISPDAELDALLFGQKSEAGWYPMPCASCSFFKRECGGPNRDKMTNVIQGRRELPMF